MNRLTMLSAALVLALALVACGDSGPGEESAPQDPDTIEDGADGAEPADDVGEEAVDDDGAEDADTADDASDAMVALPQRPADVEGTVIRVDGDTVVIESLDEGAGGSATVSEDTAVHLNDLALGSAEDIEEGDTVALWWNGPTTRSIPPQGQALAIWLVDDVDELTRLAHENQMVVAWTLVGAADPDATELTITVDAPVCTDADGSRADEVIATVDERPDVVTITAIAELGDADRECTADGEPTEVTVTLSEPLGERALADGGTVGGAGVEADGDGSDPVTDGGDPQS